jgi:6-phosphofructokinase
MSKKRIGILTSGGDCPGLNAVIHGVVKTSWQLGYDCVGFLKGCEGLYNPVRYITLTPKNTTGILNQGGTILDTTNKDRFAATVGVQDCLELDNELIESVKTTVNRLGMDGLVCVGDDGTLAVVQQFHEAGIPVVGIPKTIDNGLSATNFDRVLATQYGAHAVRLIVERRFGEMICYNPPEMGSVPITSAVNQVRQVDPDGPAVQAARALGISLGDCPADASPFANPGDLPVPHEVLTAQDVAEDAQFVLELAQEGTEEALG